MTTPRTKAGQAEHDFAWGDEPQPEDADREYAFCHGHKWDRDLCPGCIDIAAIEDEMEQRVKAALRDELYRQRNELPFGYVNGLGVAIDAIERVKVTTDGDP